MFRHITRCRGVRTGLRVAATLACVVLAPSWAEAQDRYWTTGTGSLVAGNGDWNTTTALWSINTGAASLTTFPQNAQARFQAVGTSNVSLTESITTNGIFFDNGNAITKVNAGGGTLTLGGNITSQWNNGGAATVNELNAPLALSGNRTITFGRNYGDGVNGNYLVIGGAITETGGARSLTINQTSGGGGGNGTLYLDSPDNTFSGGLSAGGRFVYARAASGTPLGTGNIDTRAGFGDTPIVPIYIQPTGSGANVQIAAANALTTSRININGGGLFQLVKGTQTSLTFTVGNAGAAADSVLNRVGIYDGMTIGYTGTLGVDEKFIVNGGVSMTNGLVTPFFTASSPTSRDFMAYDVTNGFVLPTYSFTNTFAGATTASSVKVTSATTLSGNAGASALNLSSGSVNLGGNTLTLGDGTNAAGLIQAGTISNGTLNVPGVAVVTGASGALTASLTGSGSFVFAGSPITTLGGSQVAVASIAVGSGSLTFNPDSGVQDVTSVISGTGATIAKSGAGQTRLASATATALAITAGTVSLDSALTANPTISLTSTAIDSVSIGGNTAKLTMNAGTLSMSGGIRFGNDSGVGVAEISGGTVNQAGQIIDLGFNGGRGSLTLSGTALYNGSGRQLRLSNAWQGNSWVFVKDSASGTFGEITLADANNVNGTSQFGTVIVSDSGSLTGTSLVIGKLTTNTSSRGFGQFVQQGGTTAISGTVELGRSQAAGSTLEGSLNLDGGTFSVGDRIFGGTGNSYVNFHGGTLAYSGGTERTNFFNLGGTGKAFVYDSSTIDTGAQAVTIEQALLTPNAGSGLSSVPLTTAGSGFTVAPGVRITGGGGEGATAIATIGVNGALSISVTNPGTGYTSAPTIVLERGHRNGGAEPVVGTVSIATNAYTGGITKQGAGRLTLTAANTFTGPTVIGAGTLALSGSGTHGAGTLSLGTSGIFELTALSAGTYTLASSASLVGNGSILGGSSKTLAVPGILAPGNSTGTITLDSAVLELTSTTTSNFEINSLLDFDEVVGSGSGSQVIYGGTLNVVFDPAGSFASGNTFQLFDIGGSLASSGSFSTVNTTGLTGGLTASFDTATGSVLVVPEPSTVAMLLLAGAVAAGCRTRWRRA